MLTKLILLLVHIISWISVIPLEFIVKVTLLRCFSDPYIQQAKRKYMDRNRQAMAAVNSELQDVTRIMVSNIDEVLHRGEALNSKLIIL